MRGANDIGVIGRTGRIESEVGGVTNGSGRFRRRIMEWLLAIAAVIVGVLAWVWLMQERMIFFPQPVSSAAHLKANAAPLEIVAEDGTHLRGWVVEGATLPAPAVIYFGGNAEEVSWTLADPRWPREWTIVGVNYRGYGTSEGKPGQRELALDALAIYDALARIGDIDRTRIVAFGRSLGTGIAIHLAAERPVTGAVLVSPYDSMTALGKLHYPWLPVSLLLRHPFDALPEAKKTHVPMLAIVGEADTIIPPERSRVLFDAWAGPKTWLAIPGAGHNDLSETDLFWRAIARFLAER
jgi:pimeloyl-ACP methyl ester carboxylesterase